MTEYSLKSGVFLVEGAFNSALLDTNTGNIYSVNKKARDILNYSKQDDSYWQTLVDLGLANLSKEMGNALPTLESTDQLKFAWFEIVTDDCNERCAHCYADSMPRTYRRDLIASGQIISSDSVNIIQENNQGKKRMTYSDWITILKQSHELGCKSCQFIGGEPFLYKGENGETVLDLAEAAKSIGFKSIEIYTNGTLLTKSKVIRIKKLGIKIAVSLYSDDAKIHDEITRTHGSHDRTMKGLALLKKHEVRTRVEMVLMNPNQDTIESTIELRNEMGFSGRSPDPLRPKGRGDNPLLQPDFEKLVKYGLKLKPNFVADSKTIARFRTGHPCMLGKITVTEFGDVLPCIFSRNMVVGNVLVASHLRHILEGKALDRVWKATKDNVLVCKDCEYRYVCFDCRPLSEAVANGNATYLDAPYPRCTYNPYTGEWKEGLWRVNHSGTPYYDRSFAPKIKKVAESTVQYIDDNLSH